MPRALLRYIANLAAALAPLLTLHFSPLDAFLGPPDAAGNVHLWLFTGTKDAVALSLAVGLALVAVTFLSVAEFVDFYMPQQDLDAFRRDYLESQREEWEKELGANVRINVMYARRPFYTLFLIKRLQWVWGHGYRPPHAHRDARLCFWYGQGVCGQAFHRERALFADLSDFRPTGWRKLGWNEFLFGPRKVSRTSGVRAVLSIPLFLERGERWHCVGVINVDTMEGQTAKVLEANQDRLIQYFTDAGTLLAKLRH